MEGVPEEFIDVYEKVKHIFENASGRDADADMEDPVIFAYKNFAPTIEVAITTLKSLDIKIPSVAIKNRVCTLKLELFFLRTTFRCMVKRCFEDGLQGRFMDILGRLQSQFVCANQVLDLYVRKKKFDEVEAVGFDAAICSVLEKITIMKPEIMEAYYLLYYLRSPSKYPMSAELVVEYIYLVIDALGLLLISYYSAVPPMRKQVLDLGEKLKLMAKFIWFTGNQGFDGVQLKYILISAEAVADNAAAFSYFLWLDSEVDQMLEIKLIDSDARHISAGTLTVLQQFDSRVFVEFEVGFLNFLRDVLNLLIKDTAFIIQHEEVRFLNDLMSYPGILYTEQKELLDVGGLMRRIGSVICSPFYYENFSAEINTGQQELLEILKLFKAEAQEIFSKVLTQQKSKFPEVGLVVFINFFHEELKELISTKADMIIDVKDQILAIQGELAFCRSFLQDIADHPGDVKLDDVVKKLTVAAYEAEHIISLLLITDIPAWHKSVWVSDFTEQIKLIKASVSEISKDASSDKRINIADKDPSHAPSQLLAPSDVVVGFKDEIELIKELLARGPDQLQVVSIVGMPGLGKTTLAKRLYEDPLIVEHFYVRGWCYVSPHYSKKEMLLSLLSSVIKLTDEIREMKDDEDLSEMLYKQLKGRRYLIVMDDVWGMDALQALTRFFPDDCMGSRIMLTSRNKSVGSEAKYHCDAIELRLLTEDESWDILKAKVFHQEICPSELEQVGKQIAQKCSGLRLAVVVVAGLLASSDKKQGFWKQVSENLSSHILGVGEGQGMEVLDLSYKLLPDHLKPLFLYLGAFPADQVIPVRKLIWLWIAEGFVPRAKLKSLEDAAENKLMDLIDRSLVIIADRRSDGRVKTCRVHDLLRDLCLEKAKEENFLQQTRLDRFLHDPFMFEHRRLSIQGERKSNINVISMPYGPAMRSLLLFSMSHNVVECLRNLKLLRVFDLERHVANEQLFDDLTKMINLRYLSVLSYLSSIPSSIVNLWNLEALIVRGNEFLVPHEIWKMAKLRHLHINYSGKFILDENAPEDTSKLLNLETFSTPSISLGEEKKLMQRIPNVRKLRCIFQESLGTTDMFPKLGFPDELESLNARCQGVAGYLCEFDLPLSLKKLTLSGFHLQWNVISSFQKLPNLEILKLVEVELESDLWDMGDCDFPKLKFLKLESLNIKQWNASSDNFPCLEQLVLRSCHELLEIPSTLGDICSLESITVVWSLYAAKSAKQIQEEQKDAGNDLLKVHIYPPHFELQKDEQDEPENLLDLNLVACSET